MRPSVALALAAALALPGCLSQLSTIRDEFRDRLTAREGLAPDCSINARPDNWTDPCTARASWNEAPSKAEVDLAVNPRDPLNVIVASKDLDRVASDCVWSVAQVTKDGGRTWKTVYVGGDRANRSNELRPFACVTDPILAFDSNGVLYYALQAYRFLVPPSDVPTLPRFGKPIVGSTFILARSTDGGETFDRFVPQHVGDGVAVFHDYPRMLVNPKSGSVHTIWNGVGQAGVTPWVSTSRDGGESVDAPVTFYARDAPRGTQFYGGFAATRDGRVYATVNKLPGGEAFGAGGDGSNETGVFLFTSADDGRSFAEQGLMFNVTPTPRQLPTNEFRTPSFVELAVDTTDGAFADRLYAVWPDYRTGDSDVLSAYSADGGKSWSAPVRVHANATNDQFMARPTVGPDGTVYVLHHDRERDPENRLLDAALAWSTDGGATWRNLRLTATAFDGDLGVHQNGFPFIGDYNGIGVAVDGTVYAAWGDTRTGVAEIALARVAPQR